VDSVRTCLVCRKKAQKFELCRFVRAVDGEICFDEKGTLESRGAWLCADKACVLKAFQKRMLFRGERTLPSSGDTMLDHMRRRIKISFLSKLGFSRKLGQLETGKDAVMRLVGDGKIFAVLLAKDLSDRSKDSCHLWKERMAYVFDAPLLMDEIGQCLGRRKTGVVGLMKSRITDEILLHVNKLSKLEL
jgi:predicted RNA-binding protein YlxR (DUF448 family)